MRMTSYDFGGIAIPSRCPRFFFLALFPTPPVRVRIAESSPKRGEISNIDARFLPRFLVIMTYTFNDSRYSCMHEGVS